MTEETKESVARIKELLSVAIERGTEMEWPGDVATALRELADEQDAYADELYYELVGDEE